MIDVPEKIKNYIKEIEIWADKQTTRNDWAIGKIACRKGFEKLLKNYKKLEQEHKKLKKEVEKLRKQV